MLDHQLHLRHIWGCSLAFPRWGPGKHWVSAGIPLEQCFSRWLMECWGSLIPLPRFWVAPSCHHARISHPPHFSMLLYEWGVFIVCPARYRLENSQGKITNISSLTLLDPGLFFPSHYTCRAPHTPLCTRFIQVSLCIPVRWRVTQHVSLPFQVNPRLWQNLLL